MKKRAAQSVHHASSFWPDSVATRSVAQPSSARNFYLDPECRFSIASAVGAHIESLLKLNPYAAALAFVNGEISVEGDLVSAIRFFLQQNHSALAAWCCALLAGAEEALPWRWSSKENISFHYDRPNEFYELFLDSRMLYSAAHFETTETSLEDAQVLKLDRICADLRLRPGERFLDIGCGWGALIIRASQHYGAISRGCTLSDQQFLYARSLVRKQGLEDCVTVENCHYRDLKGTFDKIASVGMFEHVRKNHLFEYFRKVYDLLDTDGLFLNRGIVRPEGVKDGPETLFLQRNVFPGGHLVHLADVVRAGERAGFEALAVESLRQHYARTCVAWVNRLQTNCARAIQLVGAKIYRTWLLYLAASAVNFEDQVTSAAQLVFAKACSGSHAKKRFLSF
jgi:cyclopropane-fatty-acyl-phospholipid synthase